MYPQIDPVALQVGPLAVHWYGLTYLAAFALFMLLGTLRLRHPPFATARTAQGTPLWTRRDVEDILFLGVLGVVLGGRLGYCLFYKPAYYLSHPLEVFFVWQGGMSFHGGLLGVGVALAWFAYSRQRSWLQVADFVAPCVPTGLAAGRVGNFINGELWGKVSDVPWAIVFPGAGPNPRHPSQLYEAALEGLVLFFMVWIFSSKPRKTGAVSGLFALGYGVFRFAVEFVRMPDVQLGYLAFGWLTMGQLLCVPLILAGLWLVCRKAPVLAPHVPPVENKPRPGGKSPKGRKK